ncbi:MAG: formylglycine-generating enzyme family protein [Alphaproteobacteria bacterium]|nr:formylglycine-generating enzyme family protein [Alphaproteobacteria bacterium]
MKSVIVLSVLGILAAACVIVSGNARADGPGVGETFRDCPECPEMVVVPAGEFMMGSPEGEGHWYGDEGPAHGVSVQQPFAIGKYEVTRAQYAAFVKAIGLRSKECYVASAEGWKLDGSNDWRSPGFPQTDTDPVVCVRYKDTKAFAEWLSRETGHAYRLPSEAEWEYAARAGTTTEHYWGASADEACRYANVLDESAQEKYPDDWDIHECRDGHVHTSPVGSFSPNAFGLYDMLGNVSEWVEDCWYKNYWSAPKDASVWTVGDCSVRVIRGGNWRDGNWDGDSSNVRSAKRGYHMLETRASFLGFRVTRTLP